MIRATVRWRQLLDARGRADRTEFLSITALGWGVFAVCGVLVHLMARPALFYVAIGVVSVATIAVTVVSAINMVRRLHDWGRSGWWLLLLLLIEAPLAAVSEPGWFPEPVVVIGNLLLALYVIAIVIFFGAVPGQKRENRFGPPPSGPQAAEAFS